MNLKFICSEDFGIAGEICLKVRGYLPNLISKIEIIGNDAFKGIFETREIVPKTFSARPIPGLSSFPMPTGATGAAPTTLPPIR